MFGRARLKRENAALREALGWYAQRSNYRRTSSNKPGDPKKWVKSPIAFDRGARALFTLTTLDEPKRFTTRKVVDVPTAKPPIQTSDAE